MERGPTLEWPVPGAPFALSARRIHEHARLRQVNPFRVSLAEISTAEQAGAVIDLIATSDIDSALTGLTLAGLRDLLRSRTMLGPHWHPVRKAVREGAAREAQAFVLKLARASAARRATRNPPAPLLPPAQPGDVLGVPQLHSRLCDYLEQNPTQRQRPAQWLATLTNLAARGLREEELQRSGLQAWLRSRPEGELLYAADLRAAVDFSALQVSIIANIDETRAQLCLQPSGPRALPAARGVEKLQKHQRRALSYFDPVFGYRIEAIERDSLWGTDRYWQALTYRGTVLRDPVSDHAICDTPESAARRAHAHARERYPKLHAAGAWGRYAWTGGEDYREWLITLPFFPWTYLSSHFDVRNVLAHVRCDLREGAEGERVLLLQEVQSDWMQDMRRELADIPDPDLEHRAAPFLREWPALALKLMCLHAAHTGCDAIAWLRGQHQADRYGGQGRDGLENVYDRELPRAADRIVKAFSLTRGALDVYVPRNFRIRSVEDRYEVLDLEGNVLGTAGTFIEARRFVPDGAHEELCSVHGVRLTTEARVRLKQVGLAIWG